jgi:hypothetical protein
MDPLQGGAGKLRLPQELVGPQHAVDLLPRGRHQGGTLFLDYLRSHAASAAIARVKI